MPYYEVIYETGSISVAYAESDEELAAGLKEQHTRAKSGMPGGPAGNPGERIVDVLKYDTHPASYGEEQAFSADEAKATINDLIDQLADENGVVSKHDLTQAIHATSDSMITQAEREPGKSVYKADETGSLKPALWGGDK